MSHIIHRQLSHTPPVATYADGAYFFDHNGKRYLDGCGGAAVSSLGHRHPEVIQALHSQIDNLAYAHTGFFTSDAAEQLADQLVATAPSDLNAVYFVSGGSEAIETALKLARQYWVEAGQPQRQRFIARKQSYHGNTLGALAVGGNEWRREPFAHLLMDVIRVSACNAYRDQRLDETEQDYTQRLLREFEDTIIQAGPETIIGFCAETVSGATTGAVPPTPGYFAGIRRLCDKYDILYIADEVMCGMGRTGSLHAFTQEDIVPDIVTIAKGLGGGYQPIGAVLARDKIIRTLAEGSGQFQHGHTYICHPTAAAAALVVQQVIQRQNLLANVQQQGDYLLQQLSEKIAPLEFVGDTRGRGLFAGIELVRDKASKTPFAPELKLHAQLKRACFEQGLMIYPMGGTIDGRFGDHILLAPPFIVTPSQIDFMVETLSHVITEITHKSVNQR